MEPVELATVLSLSGAFMFALYRVGVRNFNRLTRSKETVDAFTSIGFNKINADFCNKLTTEGRVSAIMLIMAAKQQIGGGMPGWLQKTMQEVQSLQAMANQGQIPQIQNEAAPT